MVVGPEFGPIAGFCVALVQRRGDLVKRSLLPLVIGFPLGIAAAYLFALGDQAWSGSRPTASRPPSTRRPSSSRTPTPSPSSSPYFAGTAGVLSLTSAKSGALVGVLISVTTIPAAANVGVAAAYRDGEEMRRARRRSSLVNLTAIVMAGVLTLFIQRKLYQRRRRAHLHDAGARGCGAAGRAEPPGEAQTRRPTALRKRASRADRGGANGKPMTRS